MTRPPVRGDDDWADDDGWYDEDADWAADDPGVAHDEPAYEYVAEYEDLPPQASRSRRVLAVLAIVVVFFLIVVGGGTYYLRGQLDPGGPVGDAVSFTIPTGTSANEVASLLEDQGIVVDAQVFRWYLRFKGADGFEAGDYALNQNMAAWDVLAVLNEGPTPITVARFTVPPGLTLSEIPGEITDDIPSFETAELARLITLGQTCALGVDAECVRPESLPPGQSLEGYLFPDTYDIEVDQGPQAALQRMASQMDAVIAELEVPRRASELGRSVYEIITIASLIQEEYGVESEMGKIARVIYNRLEVGEPLGIDATSRYLALITTGDRNDVDFSSDSPYNTRRVAGLPPTPIATPGRAAIEAALSPEPGPWIYYVRDPDAAEPGGHFFTDSASEFERVKDACEEANLGCG